MTTPSLTLNNGIDVPQLGLGVWRVSDDEAQRAVTIALDNGYRSVDTATLYHNEGGVGRAIARSPVAREELFVTTKLWNDDQGHDAALRAFDESLSRLGLNYVDLYLIHWPYGGSERYIASWRALERIYTDKRARAIGVSNFNIGHLERLAAETDIVPAVNQIELHPYLAQQELREYHDKHGIRTESWRPLGQGSPLLSDITVAAIAEHHGKTVAQVVLRWQIQLGNIVIPKSVTPSRIAENIEIFDFTLDGDDMAIMATLDAGRRLGPSPDRYSV